MSKGEYGDDFTYTMNKSVNCGINRGLSSLYKNFKLEVKLTNFTSNLKEPFDSYQSGTYETHEYTTC